MSSTYHRTDLKNSSSLYMNLNIDGLPNEGPYQPYYLDLFNNNNWNQSQQGTEEQQTIHPASLMLSPDTPFTPESFSQDQRTPQRYESWNETLSCEYSPSCYSPVQYMQEQDYAFQPLMSSVSSTNCSSSPVMSDNSFSNNNSFISFNSETDDTYQISHSPQDTLFNSSDFVTTPTPYSQPLPSLSNEWSPLSGYLSDLPAPPPQRSPQRAATDASIKASQDDFIVRCRAQKISYKEILRLGNFTCAESTLRGRYRAIMVERDQRPRKPIWKNLDEQLLVEAVEKMSSADRIAKVLNLGTFEGISMLGVSWVGVKEYIVDNGGSLPFGNSTCKKKWAALHGLPDGPCRRDTGMQS